MFNIFFEKQANKDLYKINAPLRKNILLKIKTQLLINPFPNGYNPKKLKGEIYLRFRVGQYRVLYTIKKDSITIYAILHRKDAYKKL